MGFRFRKSIKISKGVSINVGKKSVGLSVGVKGARHSVSSSGRRTTTVGLPGTGLSYSKSHTKSKQSAPSSTSAQEPDYLCATDECFQFDSMKANESRAIYEEKRQMRRDSEMRYIESLKSGCTSDDITDAIYFCFLKSEPDACMLPAFNTLYHAITEKCAQHGGKLYKTAAKSAKYAIVASYKFYDEQTFQRLRSKGFKVVTLECAVEYMGLQELWDSSQIAELKSAYINILSDSIRVRNLREQLDALSSSMPRDTYVHTLPKDAATSALKTRLTANYKQSRSFSRILYALSGLQLFSTVLSILIGDVLIIIIYALITALLFLLARYLKCKSDDTLEELNELSAAGDETVKGDFGTDTITDATVFYDKDGDEIDLAVILGVYPDKARLSYFLNSYTKYTPDEIPQIIEYALANVAPNQYTPQKRAEMKAQIETAFGGRRARVDSDRDVIGLAAWISGLGCTIYGLYSIVTPILAPATIVTGVLSLVTNAFLLPSTFFCGIATILAFIGWLCSAKWFMLAAGILAALATMEAFPLLNCWALLLPTIGAFCSFANLKKNP